jgi:uncharacterized repeat protein (TIGR01451 family)
MHKPLVNTLLLGLAIAVASFAYAQPLSGNIEFKNIAEVEREVKTADGKLEKKREPVQKAVPGTVVIYTSTFKNVGAKPAGNIIINNPIPANTTLVAASAFGEGMDISYSADGGKSWASADKVKVKDADGKERPAGISEFTHIRWSLRGELVPGKQGEAGFRVVVN